MAKKSVKLCSFTFTRLFTTTNDLNTIFILNKSNYYTNIGLFIKIYYFYMEENNIVLTLASLI